MAEVTLTLSEHELYFLPSGTAATAPATRVEIEGETFLARVVLLSEDAKKRRFYSIFYQSEVAEDPGIFANGACLSGEKVNFSTLTDTDIIHKKVAEYKNFSQRYWCSPEKDYGITFVSSGALVRWRYEKSRENTGVYRSTQPAFLNGMPTCPQREFLALCHEDHLNNSDLHYVLSWRKLTDEQKNEIAFGCQHGSWQNLHRLYSLVQLIVVHRFDAFMKSGSCQWQFDYEGSTTMGAHGNCIDAISWIEHWRHTLCEIFQPNFWSGEHACVYKWRNSENRRDRCIIRCATPTHHELLEAQLELREFLSPHLPDDEIEALLRPE